MLFRKKSLPFVDEWIRVIEADDKIWDQNAFNDLARKGQQILPDDPNNYFKGACKAQQGFDGLAGSKWHPTYACSYHAPQSA